MWNRVAAYQNGIDPISAKAATKPPSHEARLAARTFKSETGIAIQSASAVTRNNIHIVPAPKMALRKFSLTDTLPSGNFAIKPTNQLHKGF
jgi:hypothetical protein